MLIDRLVAERFGGELRIGIGINTGVVISGTIGGGGKLEFTLIGDTVNVAARVEQLTKTTGDTILLTHHTVDALAPDHQSHRPGISPEGQFSRRCRSLASTRTQTGPGIGRTPAASTNSVRISSVRWRLVSRHGSHLAVGVGSVRSEVLVGGLRDHLPRSTAGLAWFGVSRCCV